jgi:hypothetical protein
MREIQFFCVEIPGQTSLFVYCVHVCMYEGYTNTKYVSFVLRAYGPFFCVYGNIFQIYADTLNAGFKVPFVHKYTCTHTYVRSNSTWS